MPAQTGFRHGGLSNKIWSKQPIPGTCTAVDRLSEIATLPAMPSYSVSRETETRVRAEITVSADEWKAVEENVLRRIAAEAELKGFRRGKAPLHLVRREFAGELQLDTLLEIAGQSIDAIESKIEHTIYKIVSITNFQDKGNKRSFTTIADLQPYVRLPKLKVAQVRPVVPAISDDDLADAIHRELLPYAHYKEVPPEVGAEKYDRMVADVEFWIDDVPKAIRSPMSQSILGWANSTSGLKKKLLLSG